MRKSLSLVWAWSILVFLSLTCAACGWSTAPSSAAPAPSPTRHFTNQVYAMAWAPDGARLALGTKHGDIQLWNTRSRTMLLTTDRRFGEVYALAWSPDGTYLASGGQDQTVHVWNTTTGQQVGAFRSHFSTGEVLALACPPMATPWPRATTTASGKSGTPPRTPCWQPLAILVAKTK